MSQSSAAASGQCSVCGSTFKLVASTGVLRKHGWNSSLSVACVGSGRLPLGTAPSVNAPTLATTLLNESLDLFGPSSSSQLLGVDCGISPLFVFKGFQGVILKCLPKVARSFAASVLQHCIRCNTDALLLVEIVSIRFMFCSATERW